MNSLIKRTTWHHAPVHLFVRGAIYMVTGGTLGKAHFFGDSKRLNLLENSFLEAIEKHGWEMRAWALFSNHYHFIARAPDEDGGVKALIQRFHSTAARALNRLDGTPGRRVLYEYWDKCLTFEASYYSRLNYVMHNPVRHGLVAESEQYPYCSGGMVCAQQ